MTVADLKRQATWCFQLNSLHYIHLKICSECTPENLYWILWAAAILQSPALLTSPLKELLGREELVGNDQRPVCVHFVSIPFNTWKGPNLLEHPATMLEKLLGAAGQALENPPVTAGTFWLVLSLVLIHKWNSLHECTYILSYSSLGIFTLPPFFFGLIGLFFHLCYQHLEIVQFFWEGDVLYIYIYSPISVMHIEWQHYITTAKNIIAHWIIWQADSKLLFAVHQNCHEDTPSTKDQYCTVL